MRDLKYLWVICIVAALLVIVPVIVSYTSAARGCVWPSQDSNPLNVHCYTMNFATCNATPDCAWSTVYESCGYRKYPLYEPFNCSDAQTMKDCVNTPHGCVWGGACEPRNYYLDKATCEAHGGAYVTEGPSIFGGARPVPYFTTIMCVLVVLLCAVMMLLGKEKKSRALLNWSLGLFFLLMMGLLVIGVVSMMGDLVGLWHSLVNPLTVLLFTIAGGTFFIVWRIREN